MRKAIVGAIQPGRAFVPPSADCLSAAFVSDIPALVNDNVLPHLDITLDLLEQCGAAGCDLAVTSEDACQISAYLLAGGALFDALTEASARVAEERFAQIAKKYRMYVAGCYFKRVGGRNYNVCSIFGRDGSIAFEYRKTHLPPNERWHVAAGDALEVAELDFGRVGIAICYDMMFPEILGVLALRGAEIVLHPTAGYGWYDSIGEATLRTRANDCSVYLVTAKNYHFNAAGHSSVIDPWGQVRADAGFYENVIVTHSLDLDVPKVQPPWFYQTQMSGMAEVGPRMRLERRPDLYAPLTEPGPGLAVPDQPERERLIRLIQNGKCRWS